MCSFSELANVGIVAVGVCKPALSVLKGERTSFKENKGKEKQDVRTDIEAFTGEGLEQVPALNEGRLFRRIVESRGIIRYWRFGWNKTEIRMVWSHLH